MKKILFAAVRAAPAERPAAEVVREAFAAYLDRSGLAGAGV